MDNEFTDAELQESERDIQKFLEYRAIHKRLDAIEEIIIAHQSWTVLQRGERNCHMDVRRLIKSIKNIMGDE